MAARLSAKKLPRYSLEFKRKAVQLTQLPGMEVQAVREGARPASGDAVAVASGGSLGAAAGKERGTRITKKMLHGVVFSADRALRRCVTAYVRYYNHQRLHSSLGYRSPVAYEERAA